jgi:hypothetical protein
MPVDEGGEGRSLPFLDVQLQQLSISQSRPTLQKHSPAKMI